MGIFNKFKQGLTKTSSNISAVLTKKKLDTETLDELVEALMLADVGPKTSIKLVQEFSQNRFGKEISENEIKQSLSEEIIKILKPLEAKVDFARPETGPRVILFVGVNGSGKTTTIGKLAAQAASEGKTSIVAACDTFRAAAADQLKIWAQRSGSTIIEGEQNADPASLAYKAFAEAKAKNSDLLFIDTAGRLQNKKGLMDELGKIVRVLKKHDENIPHQTILVLDGTTGQNAISQAEIFKEVANITGIIVTKLDGTAKGGAVVALADQLKLPIYCLGVGEGIDDLKSFSAEDFGRAMVGLD